MVEPKHRPLGAPAPGALPGEAASVGAAIDRRRRRLDLAALAGIAAVSLWPMLDYAADARIEFDGWMHLLIARDDDWREMLRLIVINTHPPLYYLALKAVALFGTHPLLYRALSIAAAAVAVVALGVALARVSRTRAAPLLGAAAFAFATTTAIIASEVRSYMLATMFLVLALPPYLVLVRPEGGGRRRRLLFALFVGLAFATHYAILLVFLSLVAAPVVLAVVSPRHRHAWGRALRGRWRADAATLLPPTLLMAGAYLTHIGRHGGPLSHLPQFYWSREEPLWRWVVTGLERQIELFSPLAVPDPPLLGALALAAALAVPLVLLVLVLRERTISGAATLPVALLVLAAAHLVGSIVGSYPFGGSLRHQFFFFPFLVATLFLLVDRLLALFAAGGWPRRLAVAAAAAAVAFVAYDEWQGLFRPRQPLFAVEYALYRSEIPPADAVYLDGFNSFAYFGQIQDWQWSSHGYSDDGAFRVLRATRGDRSVTVLQDRWRWNDLPDDPALYVDLREALAELGGTSLAVFHLDQETVEGDAGDGAGLREETRSLLHAARTAGLAPREVVRLDGSLFARFETASAAGAGAAPRVVHLDEGFIRAVPNPIQVCEENGVGVARLMWSFPGSVIEIRLEAPDGTLWTQPPASGTADTGKWVYDGMKLYVQDRHADEPTSGAATLAALEVRHTDRGCETAGRREARP